MPAAGWMGRCRWIRQSTEHISTARISLVPQGDLSNYMNLLAEPDDHGIGRSRGGLSTKIHHLTDGNGLPLVVLIGAGQAGDSPMFPILLSHLRIERAGSVPARTRPDAVLGDKAYSSRAIRALLRSRRIEAVISEPRDQQGHRRNRGSGGGRPPKFDAQKYKGRNVVERSFNAVKQWRGLPPGTTNWR